MTLIKEIDYGTPASQSEKTVTLTIDGAEVTVPEGTSIMRAAMQAGTQIPKLCATDSIEAFGSCRLCLVEIDGRAGTPASCTTPALNGLVVHTQSPRLKQIRRGVFRSVAALEKAMMDYLAAHNENPKPFVWTANADLILERVKNVCERISNSGH